MRLLIPDSSDCPLIHCEYPWYIGSPDALVLGDDFKSGDKAIGGVDFKTTSRRQDYGEPGTDQVPDWVATQCYWYMGLTGAQWWDIAVLFFAPRRAFHIYHLERNEEIINNLIEAGKDFWENHVLPGIPPPLDASGATRRYLGLTYPQDIGAIVPAPLGAVEWLSRLQAAKEGLSELEKEKALSEAYIKEAIGDNAGILSPEWKATWKRSKDREEVDWEKAYMDLCSYVHEKGLVVNDEDFSGKHTTIKPGPRVLRVVKVKEGLCFAR